MIASANPTSVLRYYRLVNVQWTLEAANCKGGGCGAPFARSQR